MGRQIQDRQTRDDHSGYGGYGERDERGAYGRVLTCNFDLEFVAWKMVEILYSFVFVSFSKISKN